MDEIHEIISRYDETYVSESLRSLEDINKFTGTFVKDVAEIYDCITRIRNTDRNPEGFSLDDAPNAYKTFRDKKDGCVKVVLTP